VYVTGDITADDIARMNEAAWARKRMTTPHALALPNRRKPE
jgi:hypothetical protein